MCPYERETTKIRTLLFGAMLQLDCPGRWLNRSFFSGFAVKAFLFRRFRHVDKLIPTLVFDMLGRRLIVDRRDEKSKRRCGDGSSRPPVAQMYHIIC